MATIQIDQEAIASNSQYSLVLSVSGLNVSISSFSYILNGTNSTYAGIASVALTDNVTNYISIDSGGLLQISTVEYPTYDQNIFIARVTTGGGVVGNIIADRVTFSPYVKEIEIDFGTIPKPDALFTIIDDISTTSAKIIPTLSGKTATGRADGDSQWDHVQFTANPGNGSFILYAICTTGSVAGKRVVQYTISR